MDQMDRLIGGVPGQPAEDEFDPYRDERYLRIQKVLRKLPAKIAAAVHMRYIDRQSFRRIAAVQGGTIAGARNRVERGILRIVVLLHARKHRASGGERIEDLSIEDRLEVRNAAALAQARNPRIGVRWLSAEVCRATGIYIRPESGSATLLGALPHRRLS
jgi:hypothetical protein